MADAAVRGCVSRELSFLFSEETVDVPTAVKDADHVDALRMRQIKDEVLFESVHRKPAQAL